MNKELKYLPITSILKAIIDNRGKSVPTSDKGIPLIATNCIKDSSIYPTFDKIRFIDEQTHNTWFRAHLQPNDILFVNKGTPGRVCLVPDPVNFCAAQDMMGFRCNEELINYKYLFAVLRSDEIQKKIGNNHVGLVIPHFRKQDLPCLLIPIRSKKEQEQIGDLYINFSLKIELNNRINRELEQMAKLLYDYWFVQFEFPCPELVEGPTSTNSVGGGTMPELVEGKPYKTSGGKMVWNKELKREIPEGWEVGNISVLAELVGGGTPKTKEPSYWGGFIPFFTPTDNSDSAFSLSTKQNITEAGLESCSSKLFPKGTIFITARGTVGNINIASQDMAMNQSCYALKARGNVSYSFLYLYAYELVRKLKAKANGSVFDAIVSNDFKLTNLVVPPISLINKFGTISQSIFEKILNNQVENQQLASLRDWLLPMLMNGQVTVGAKEKKSYEVKEGMDVAAEPGR